MAANDKRARTKKNSNFEPQAHELDAEPLEPIGSVVRELTRPDGTTLRVEVPVYPPFRLRERKPASPKSRRG